MRHSNLGAFTLVELIVVITILAILGTIGFLSFIGYQRVARETIRIGDIKIIEKGLSIYQTKNNSLPLPDSYVAITASGNTIGYQGEVGTGVLVTLRQAGEIEDPLDGAKYSYFIDNTRISYQMMIMMESNESLRASLLPQAYAATDYLERFPKVFGKPLGIMTDSTNTPLEQLGIATLDIINESTNLYIAHYTDSDSITGTGEVLQEIIQNANCDRVTKFESAKDSIYTINPRGAGGFQVYCETEIDNGGWILIARTHQDSVGNTDFGWLTSTGSVGNDSQAYSLGADIKNIDFDQILITAHDTGKEIVAAVRLDIDKTFFQSQINSPQAELDTQYSTTSNCEMIYNTQGFVGDCLSNYKYWGAFGDTGKFVFNRQNTSESGFVFSHIIDTQNNGLPKDKDMVGSGGDPLIDNLRNENGMIFVR